MSYYKPPQKILEKYANVLVNFALRDGRGIKKGDVVRLVAWESAKPLYIEVRKAILRAGGHIISKYIPDDDKNFNPSRDFYKLASEEQLKFFPEKYIHGLVDQIDHSILIISEKNKLALEGINPKKIITATQTMKPFKDWIIEKDNQGKYSSTIALYGTSEMAKSARLTLKEYWQEIINACFLDEKSPIVKWKSIYKQIEGYRKKLSDLPIKKIHIKGKDVDLWIALGRKRKWMSGRGRNIPSFEIFTSPDWRGTNGWIRFSEPLYRYEHLITGIELEFKNGLVVKAKAKRNEKFLKEMIKAPNANKIGEFSLTDSRFSRITKFMAETLFDENMGGRQGNTHIALGGCIHDCYNGNRAKVSKKQWEELGFNDSVIHTDMVSTTKKKVTACFHNGSKKVIYKDGKFT